MMRLPFRSTTDSVLDNLSLLDWADLLEESCEFLSSQTSCKLLDEDGTLVALIFSQWWCAISAILASPRAAASASSTAVVAASSAISIIATMWPVVSAIWGPRASAWATTSAVVVSVIPIATSSASVSISACASAPTLRAASIAAWSLQVISW